MRRVGHWVDLMGARMVDRWVDLMAARMMVRWVDLLAARMVDRWVDPLAAQTEIWGGPRRVLEQELRVLASHQPLLQQKVRLLPGVLHLLVRAGFLLLAIFQGLKCLQKRRQACSLIGYFQLLLVRFLLMFSVSPW